jgi:hypothetical protein
LGIGVDGALSQRRQQHGSQHEASGFGFDERYLIYHGVSLIQAAGWRDGV